MSVIKARLKLKCLILYGGRYIYRDNRDNTEYNRICSKQMDNTMRSFIIKMGAITVSFLFAVIGPLRAYIVYGIKTTTTDTRIPFCEPKSNAEFVVNFFIQSILASHGFFMYVGLEVLLSLFENVVNIAPQLVKNDLVNTIRLYEEKSLSEMEFRWRLKKIVLTCQDTDK